MAEPVSRLRQFSFFFALQLCSYFLVVANTRAFVRGSYAWTAATDLLFASSNFLILRRIKDEPVGLWAGLGYVLGGTIGSLLSILATSRLF